MRFLLVYDPNRDTFDVFEGHTDDICDIRFLPRSHATVVCTAANDKTIRLWDLSKKQLLYTVNYAQNGERILLCNHVMEEQTLGDIEYIPKGIHIVPSPCGRYLAGIDVASCMMERGRLRIWDLVTGACLYTSSYLDIDTRDIYYSEIAFSADSSRLYVYYASKSGHKYNIYTIRLMTEKLNFKYTEKETNNAITIFMRNHKTRDEASKPIISLLTVLRDRELGGPVLQKVKEKK